MTGFSMGYNVAIKATMDGAKERESVGGRQENYRKKTLVESCWVVGWNRHLSNIAKSNKCKTKCKQPQRTNDGTTQTTQHKFQTNFSFSRPQIGEAWKDLDGSRGEHKSRQSLWNHRSMQIICHPQWPNVRPSVRSSIRTLDLSIIQCEFDVMMMMVMMWRITGRIVRKTLSVI